MLENQPDDPCEFIADYFKNVIQGTSPLVRSYRFWGSAGCWSGVVGLFGSSFRILDCAECRKGFASRSQEYLRQSYEPRPLL